MLSRKHRFHGHNSVRRTYQKGRPVRSDLMSIHVNRDERVKSTKVAVVVSKKIFKSAVKRNRVRRRIFEIIRHELSGFNQPAEIVVTVYKSEIIDTPNEQLKNTIHTLLQKAELL